MSAHYIKSLSDKPIEETADAELLFLHFPFESPSPSNKFIYSSYEFESELQGTGKEAGITYFCVQSTNFPSRQRPNFKDSPYDLFNFNCTWTLLLFLLQ